MTTYRITALALALCAASLIALGKQAIAQERGLGAGGQLLDGVAAVVNDGVVLKSELTERIEFVVASMRKQQDEQPADKRRALPPVTVIEQQVLEQLVLREIQLQRAKRVGINVSDDMLNEALTRVATNLGYTLEELPTVLAAQNVDYAAYREDSRQDMIIEQLQQRDVINRIAITPRELEQCLASASVSATNDFDYNISHILISVPANATAQDIEKAKQRVEEIHSRLDSGEDFARLAVATSHARLAQRRSVADVVPGRRRPHEAGRVLAADSGRQRFPDREAERDARRRAPDGRPAARAAHPAAAERDPG
jgi:peptidyl-prolyl cis-trans isomerase SurA